MFAKRNLLSFGTLFCWVLFLSAGNWASATEAEFPIEVAAVVESVDVEKNTFSLQGITTLDGKSILGDEAKVEASVFYGDSLVGYAGKHVRGVLQKSKKGSYRLEFIWPNDEQSNRVVGDVNKRLHRDTMDRGRKVYRGVGEFLPHFAFFNQRGEVIRRESLQGDYVVMNFIFTRCAIPKMCPASMTRMARLQREVREAGVDNVRFVTLSFDPDYDTPGILRAYAEQKGLDGANYDLLTGDTQAVKNLLKQFGILVYPEDGTLNHTMGTLLIDPKGKILYRKDGSRWGTQEFLDRLKRAQSK